MVKNRDHWTVTEVHRDRSVTVTRRTGTICLPVDYVAEHLELGYVQTSHATQGRTVDTALLLIDTPTDSRGVYTPMTRGRDGNHAYVVVEDNQTAPDVLTQALTRDWIDQPAVARKAQLDSHHTRQREPAGLGEEDVDRLEKRVHQLIEERRRARAREAEQEAGGCLQLDIN